MNRDTWFSASDFDMFYDDWMTMEDVKLNKITLGKDLALLVDRKYPEGISNEVDERYNFFYNKALALQQKLVMIQYAEACYHHAKTDFESTQNKTVPAFYGMGASKILFYVESIIIFARNALDVSASVYSDLLLGKREDSFNNLSKKILKNNDDRFVDLKNSFERWGEDRTSAYRLLCGKTHGRALRDIIIHQSVIRLEYFEYKKDSEREKLFLVLNDMNPICLDDFIKDFIEDFFQIFKTCNSCCELVLNNLNIQ